MPEQPLPICASHNHTPNASALPGSPSKWHSVAALPDRHLMILLCAVCTFINYADRVNISVAIISISKQFSFSIKQQSVILSAFFLGYIPMNIGGAILCRRFGGKVVLAIAACLWSLFTILTPVSASLGYYPLVLCRVFMGLSEGVAFPGIFHFSASWIPATERARSIAVVLTGASIGTTVALIVAPIIIRFINWQCVFYIFGGVGLVWVIAWQILARDRDQALLLSSLDIGNEGGENSSVQNGDGGDNDDLGSMTGEQMDGDGRRNSSQELGPLVNETIPTLSLERSEVALVRNILTERRKVAVCIAQCMYGLVHYTVLSWLPTYFEKVFKTSTGSLSFTCAPYVAMVISANVGGWFADWLLRRGMELSKVRRVVTLLGCSGAAVMLVIFSQMPSVWSALVCISLAMASISLLSGGYESAFLDIAKPDEAGVFKAVANTLSAFSGFVAVPMSTVVLDLVGGSWRLMFASLSMFWVVLGVLFWTMYESGSDDNEGSSFEVETQV